MAAGVDETNGAGGVIRLALLLVGDRPFRQRFPGSTHPLLPFSRCLRRVVGSEEQLAAQWADSTLACEQAQGEVVQWRGSRSAATTGPVLGQGRVIG